VTLLPSGAVALIYNPVALATVYAEAARDRCAPLPVLVPAGGPAALEPDEALRAPDGDGGRRLAHRAPRHAAPAGARGLPRRAAKDGMDALERLARGAPDVLLSDIEMPRMDGFDLVRNVRADPRLAGLPVVMITSRIAQKHRDYAAELGVSITSASPIPKRNCWPWWPGFAAAGQDCREAPPQGPGGLSRATWSRAAFASRGSLPHGGLSLAT
jgi:chemosensory pili system protein ChpA (sensor histidine kinase/response regulator)